MKYNLKNSRRNIWGFKIKGKIVVLIPNRKILLFNIFGFFGQNLKGIVKAHVNKFSKRDMEKALIYPKFIIIK